MLIQVPWVQTRLTKGAMSYFSNKLHTKITIKGVNVVFFKKFVFEGFYMEDLHHDTLLYAGKLKISVLDYILKKSKFDLRSCELDDCDLHLRKYKGEKDLNLQFILDSFKSTESNDTTKKAGLKLTCKQLVLNNIDFTLIDENDTIKEHGILFNHLHVRNIKGELSNVKIDGDSVKTHIQGLSFVDRSGFVLNELTSDVTFAPTNFCFKSLTLKTPNTSIKGEYNMYYDSLDCVNDYLNKVYIKSKFEKSIVSFKDIAFFEHPLYGMKTTFSLSGEIKGTISKLRCKNLDIGFGNVTRFRGNANLDGLPDINNTFIDLSLEGLQTDKRDLEKIELPPFDNKHFLQLPENLKDLGIINLSGKFTGFVADFVAYGNLKTALGNISSDINVKYYKPNQTTTYSGKIATQNFNLGRIIQQEPLLGMISFNAKVNGTAFPQDEKVINKKEDNIIFILSRYFKKFNADLEANIDNMDLNGYNYKNITLNGHASNRQFHGDLDIKDENINMSFNGVVDFSKDLPVFDFNATVSNARLARLKLIKRNESSSLTSNMFMHFTGNKLDNVYGTISLNHTSYIEKKDTIILNKLEINAFGDSLIKTLDLKSDIVDANIKGEYKFKNLLPVLKDVLGNFIPEYKDKTNSKMEEQKFDFTINIKNANELTKIFIPQLQVAPYTSFNGSFNSNDSKLWLTGTSPHIKFNKMTLKDFEINAASDTRTITADMNCYKFFITDSLWINDVQLSTQLHSDSVFFQAQLQNVKNSPNHAKLNGYVSLNDTDIAFIKILPSEIVINNKAWEINSNNLIDIDTNYLIITNFALTSGNQKININGKISENPLDKMNINFTKVNFNNFDQLLKTIGLKVEGIINGDVNLTGPATHLHVGSNLLIDGLKVNDDSLGFADISTTWDDQNKVVGVVANVANGNVKTIDIHGNFYPARDNDNFDFEINLDQINANLLNQFIQDVLIIDKGSKSKISGKVYLKGASDNPQLTGKLHLKDIGFVINFLNTHYTFTTDADVTNQGFVFSDLLLLDDKGNKATASGSINHKNFKNWGLNLSLNLKKFQMLNTTEKLNDLFYGTAYATGTVALNGPVENLVLKVAVKSERGTQISIPMKNATDVGESDFITYIGKNSSIVQAQKKFEANFGGLQMNFDLEVTPDAELQIIFDETVGDKIKGNGNGNLKMDINTNGTFNMYGGYTIEKGNYLFTFQNITNKPLTLQRGGTISWNGRPLEAEMDINAIYSVQAKIGDLVGTQGVASSDSLGLKQTRLVNVLLKMKGKLNAPIITFEILFPDLTDDALITEEEKALNNEAEVNKQVFALLTLGNFLPANSVIGQGIDVGNSAASNLSQLLSSQMSNLTSQLIKNVNLGVHYQPASALTKQETDLLISTQLFNDRLSVDGNFGYASNANTSNIVGDFNLNYWITKDGKLQLKVFNKTNSNMLVSEGSIYTQGVGLVYRKEFDNWKEWFQIHKPEPKKHEDTQEK